jgi:hypothetical protein
MRRWMFGVALLLTVCAAAAPARAETPGEVCAGVGTDDTARPVAAAFAPTVNALFGTRLPAEMVGQTTVFRCDGGRALVCMAGANLPCGKADAARAPSPGLAQWCRENPDAANVPAYVTGHDTIFTWHCVGERAEVARQVLSLDPRGFVAEMWKPWP